MNTNQASPETNFDERLRGLMNAIRVDAFQLLGVLQSSSANHEMGGDGGGPATVDRRTLTDYAASLRELRASSDQLAAARGDEIRAVENGLSGVAGMWSIAEETSVGGIADVDTAVDLLEQIRFDAAYQTIPHRLGEHLVGIRVGKALDFDDTFKNEIPDAKRRALMLSYLAPYAWRQGGMVDTANAVVYKISRSLWWRLASYLSPLFFAGLSIGALVFVANLDNMGLVDDLDSRISDSSALIGAFFLVLAGSIIHLIAENIKQLQAGQVRVLAIGDTLEWLHLRWAGIALTFIPILVVVFGMRLAGVDDNHDEVALYLFAGYSVDSLAGLFLTRFDTAAGARLKLFKRSLGDDGDPPSGGGGGGGRTDGETNGGQEKVKRPKIKPKKGKRK